MGSVQARSQDFQCYQTLGRHSLSSRAASHSFDRSLASPLLPLWPFAGVVFIAIHPSYFELLLVPRPVIPQASPAVPRLLLVLEPRIRQMQMYALLFRTSILTTHLAGNKCAERLPAKMVAPEHPSLGYARLAVLPGLCVRLAASGLGRAHDAHLVPAMLHAVSLTLGNPEHRSESHGGRFFCILATVLVRKPFHATVLPSLWARPMPRASPSTGAKGMCLRPF